jgi:Ala-tRNA(Pro) deacylase
MTHTPESLLARLDQLEIAHTVHEHPAIFTVEEARTLTGHLPGGHCKSLFLKDKKGGLWLLVCLDYRRIDMNRLARTIDSPRLSFGKADLLEQTLGVTPGSVTPFALINDQRTVVRPLLDKAMLDHELLNYHPLTNTMTTAIAAGDLIRFIRSCGHEPRTIDLDVEGIDRSDGASVG